MRLPFHLSRISRFPMLFIIPLLLTTWHPGDISAQSSTAQRRDQFTDIVELIKLLEKAGEAGFDSEYLKNLYIQDGDRKISVYEYMEQKRLAENIKNKKLKEFLEKQFLTIQDIYNELVKLEPETLMSLREELVSVR